MHLLHRLRHSLATKLRERETVAAFGRLDERRLADLGLSRPDIRPVARLAARSGPSGVSLGDVVHRLRQVEDTPVAVELPRVSRGDIARYVKEGRRLRDAEIAKLARKAGRGLASLGHALAEPVLAAARVTGLSGRVELALVRRREFRKVRAELDTYSARELLTDLRLVPSEIGQVAAEAAAMRADEHARGRHRRRQAYGWRSRSAGAGYAGG